MLLGWIQWQGLSKGVLGRGVMELWVHGRQPTLSWVPFIHPPGYSLFMNVTDSTSRLLGIDPALNVLAQGWICRIALVLLVAWAVDRWIGAPPALLAAALVATSPNGLRPFEHYPVATLLATVAAVAIVEFARGDDVRSRWIAVAAVLVAVEVHLSTWFFVGGAMATIFFIRAERRREAGIASAAMIGLFMLTTIPGLWRVLQIGQGDDPERTHGVTSIEWTNPWLLGVVALWLLPPLFRRAKEGAALAGGVALFTAITVWLQYEQFADGQPYPYSLHYFELVDPAIAIAVAWALHLVASAEPAKRWRTVGATLAAAGLLFSQVWLLYAGQEYVFLNKFWFWSIAWPFG